MKEGLISRKTAIDRIEWYDEEEHEHPGLISTESVVKILQDLPDAGTESEWISCSKKLPEKTGMYLTTGRRGTVYATAYDADSKRWYGGIKAIAWKPMPEPYKGEGE